jgi:hypothetical protein
MQKKSVMNRVSDPSYISAGFATAYGILKVGLGKSLQ